MIVGKENPIEPYFAECDDEQLIMNHLQNNEYPLHSFYSKIYSQYDLVNRLFTWGMDSIWRRRTARICLEANPDSILDVCCGTGALTFEISKLSQKNIRLTGYDFNRDMLDVAEKKKIRHVKNNKLHFIEGDVADMPFHEGEFDAITISFGFRNLTYDNPKARRYLNEISRVLKREGKLFILESGVPNRKIIRIFHKFYLRFFLVPLGGIISGNMDAYQYLARSSAGYFNLIELEELLKANGFVHIKSKSFFLSAANLIVAQKQ